MNNENLDLERTEEKVAPATDIDASANVVDTADIAPIVDIAPMIDIQKAKLDFSRLGLGLALFTLVSFTAAMIISIIVKKISPEFYDSLWFANMLSPIALYLFALPVNIFPSI